MALRTLMAPEMRLRPTRPLNAGSAPLRPHHPLLIFHFLHISLPNPASKICLKCGIGMGPVSQGEPGLGTQKGLHYCALLSLPTVCRGWDLETP